MAHNLRVSCCRWICGAGKRLKRRANRSLGRTYLLDLFEDVHPILKKAPKSLLHMLFWLGFMVTLSDEGSLCFTTSLFVKVLGPLGEGINHRENGGTFEMVPFIITPLYILGSFFGESVFFRANLEGFKQLGYLIPRDQAGDPNPKQCSRTRSLLKPSI